MPRRAVPSLLSGRYSAVKVRKILYVTVLHDILQPVLSLGQAKKSPRLVVGGHVWMRRKAVGWQAMVTGEQNGGGAITARKTNLQQLGL